MIIFEETAMKKYKVTLTEPEVELLGFFVTFGESLSGLRQNHLPS
jgi:hypothetical protein